MNIPFSILPLLFLAIFLGAGNKPKTVKGTLSRSARLASVEKGSICSIDSGGSDVLLISHEHENPLFESKSPNRVNAHLEFKNGIRSGHQYQLPDTSVIVCYYEKGDLLMFHTFSGEGSIRMDWSKDSTSMTGEIDLKFVRPHHNMSNSDYHYIGGKLQVKLK